ncbi:MAG: hypothetical protein V4631_21045 [Pseudomonadota bacterium]
MEEVRSVESIKRNASEAAERVHAGKEVSGVNPFIPESDGHHKWAIEFYVRTFELNNIAL